MLNRLVSRLSSICFVLTATFVLAACGSGDADSNVSDDLINQQETKWDNQRIEDYTLVYQERGGGPDVETTVEVRNDRIRDISEDRDRFRPGGPVSGPFTVDGLFDLVRRAKDDAQEITIRFNNEFGFPDNITVDWQRGGIDERYNLEVVRFSRQ